MRWDDILAMSVAKYSNIPVLCSITDTFIEERIGVHHVEKFLADDGTWKGTSTKANTGVQQIDFLQVHIINSSIADLFLIHFYTLF